MIFRWCWGAVAAAAEPLMAGLCGLRVWLHAGQRLPRAVGARRRLRSQHRALRVARRLLHRKHATHSHAFMNCSRCRRRRLCYHYNNCIISSGAYSTCNTQKTHSHTRPLTLSLTRWQRVSVLRIVRRTARDYNNCHGEILNLCDASLVVQRV